MHLRPIRGKFRLASSSPDRREIYHLIAVALGVFAVVTTEVLSAFGALTRIPLSLAWALAIAFAIFAFLRWIRRRGERKFTQLGYPDLLLLSGTVAVLAVVGFIALLSPPNSFDSMVYHLPRVFFWAQQHSVRFFATSYLPQIMLQPVAEYLMLQTYILSGGDHFVNLVQWFGCVTSVIGVSSIAKRFGAAARGQIFAALICATIPNGILQASGVKNDYILSAWLVAAAVFLLSKESWTNAIFAGLALGLAIGTKATAYLFAPPLVLAIVLRSPRRWLPKLPAIAAIALTLNLPQFVRNIDLSGSPLGYAGPFGDARFHWQNDRFGWRETLSNLIRHSTEQLGARDPRWNRKLYEWALAAHRAIGADPNDPATAANRYEPPRNANHEFNAPNRWQMPLFAACFLALFFRREWRPMLLYTVGLLAGLLLFCFYLKWWSFMARMFLPLFVLASPIAGVLMEKIRPAIVPLVVCLFLLNNARPYVFENWVRPLKGEHSLLRTSRDMNYFSDMSQLNNRESYLAAVRAAATLDCDLFGIDANLYQVEYPFEALLKERKPGARFLHTGVQGPAAKYATGEQPCAVLCLNCAGSQQSAARYQSIGTPQRFGEFLLFTR